MIAWMVETAFNHACCQFCNRDLHINILLIIIFTVAHILMQIESLQLNDNAYVHLTNLDCAYVTLVIFKDDATSLMLGEQSQKLRYLCKSGLHKIYGRM